MGFELKRGRHQKRLAEVERALVKLGLKPETELVAEWVEERTPRQSLEALAERLYSYTRQVPPEVFAPAIKELFEWASAEYGDLDKPYPLKWKFYLRRTEK